jgi:hypothetical protein
LTSTIAIFSFLEFFSVRAHDRGVARSWAT